VSQRERTSIKNKGNGYKRGKIPTGRQGANEPWGREKNHRPVLKSFAIKSQMVDPRKTRHPSGARQGIVNPKNTNRGKNWKRKVSSKDKCWGMKRFEVDKKCLKLVIT